jgi:predicted phosphodiesterase
MDQINKFNEEIKDIPKIKKVNQYSDLERYWKYELKERRIPIDGSVLHVSDIHSHYRILNDEVPSPEDYSLTVFVGDYIDGPEVGGSRKIIDQILSYSEDDIVFLEGNHELRLRKYLGYLLFKSRGRKVVSEILLEEIPDEFLETTAKEFKDLLPFEAHEMLDKLNKILKDFVIYSRGDCTYICTHSGLRWLEQLSPKYIGSVIYSNKNVDRIDKAFSDSYKTQNIFSIHGHCSYPSGLDFLKYDRVVNIDVENENCINYFINEKNNKFKLCILKEE